METILKTKDRKTVIITHREPLTEFERSQLCKMTSRMVFHAPYITGFRVEE